LYSVIIVPSKVPGPTGGSTSLPGNSTSCP